MRMICKIVLIAASAFVPVSVMAQATGIVTGSLTDQGSGRPITAGRVNVVGTGQNVPIRDDGSYIIRGLSAGPIEVRVFALGHEARKQSVTVRAGTTTRLDFVLPSVAVHLDEIVTTATGDQRKLEVGTVIGTVKADSLVATQPIKNMTDLLTARVPGVQVLPGNLTGTGARIRIRGLNSLSLNNDPIFIIDGVRMESSTGSSSIGVGGPIPSRLSDINPQEIETIDVVKGPSAATLYGTDASNGVIVITTKKGRPGKAKWVTFAEHGTITDRNTYPTAYTMYGHSPATPTTARVCILSQLSLGTCVKDSVLAYNIFADPTATPFAHGWREQYGAQVSGGSDVLRYFVSGSYEGETGLFKVPPFDVERLVKQNGIIPGEQLRPNTYNRLSARANMNISLSPNADLAISTGFTSSTQKLPQTDNNGTGLLSSAYGGPGTPNNGNGSLGYPLHGYRVFTPGDIFQETVTQEINRFIGVVNPNWRPLSWLTARGNFGIDLTNRVDSDICRFANCSNSGTSRQGFRINNRTNFFQYTVDVSSTAQFNLTPSVQSKTTAGAQYFRHLFARNGANSSGLPPGATTVTAGAVKGASESTDLTVTAGVFLEQTLSLHDRLFLTGALRADNNSSFGKNFKKVIYPKAQVSWILSDEPFFPQFRLLDQLRLRAAYGASGNSPGANDALPFYAATTVNISDVATSALQFSALGNRELKPERATETELGADVELFDRRLSLELTSYNKLTHDALISRPVPGSIGASGSRFENIGGVQNKGIEVSVNAKPFQTQMVSFDIGWSSSWNENKLTNSGGLPPIVYSSTNRSVEGYPLFGYWARPYTFSDKNSDGIITVDELTVADSLQYIGRVIPHVEMVFSPGFDLFNKLVRLSAQVDYKGGYISDNDTERIRCQTRNNCRGLSDPTAPLDQQARVIALRDHASRTQFGFFESGNFTRLREVALTLTAPRSWAARLPGDHLSLTLAGRNLHKWTSYTGIDPESNYNGQADVQSDFQTEPPPSYYTVRFNIGF